MVEYQDIELNGNANFDERPIRILDRAIKKLRNKEILLVKVQWNNHNVEEALKELESQICAKNPEFFSTSQLRFWG